MKTNTVEYIKQTAHNFSSYILYDIKYKELPYGLDHHGTNFSS